jgi:NAD(P)-dependent dehydrogenase (short-subunit alcohol dehydrogenase family)
VSQVAGDVKGAVFIVSGAGSGIGQATALHLLRESNVLGVDLDSQGLDATAATAQALRGRFMAMAADVSVDDACSEIVKAATRLGRLSGIINCAGVMPADDHVEKLDPETWDRTFAVNVRPIYLLARHGLAHMRDEGGVIVNVASVHAYASTPATSSYAASKGAIVSLTQQLALDLVGDAIRVVGVAPGSVDTPMSQRAAQRSGFGSIAELGFPTSPRSAGRIGAAEEVAEVIAWLISPSASFVNGSVLRVDGALLAALPAAPSGSRGPQ